jgi:hypothetical protein
MYAKTFKLVLVLAVVWLMSLSDVGLIQGASGRVLNRRTRQSFPTINAALAASQSGDILLAAGRLNGEVDFSLAPGGVTILSEVRPAFVPTVVVPFCPAGLAVINTNLRNGAVQLIGLNVQVPNGCIGVVSQLNGFPLTVKSCRFFGENAAAFFTGIVLSEESDGPFLIQGNTISNSQVLVGIQLIGDGSTPIQATIKSNRIGNANSRVGAVGIAVSDIPSSSTVIVERNVVDGGNPPTTSQVGIRLQPVMGVGANDVIVRRNTVTDFMFGIVVDGSPGSEITANVVRDNRLAGIAVDTTTDSGTSPLINNNNITCTNLAGCKAGGSVGLLFSMGSYSLDAKNNYWSAPSGPDSRDNPSPGNANCPEAKGAGCSLPAGGGTGLPVDSVGATDCGTAAGTVTICPIRTLPNAFAGA